ncbi:MAG: peptidoglycan-binding protein [Firmicutes bacterium HGW-Firmicutes-8]|nr:MAG: peptidoglycan-binding protein [Firmicutes bacterium HGW-Firmicutes-8]
MNRLSLKLGTVFLVGVLVILILAGSAEASTNYTVKNGDSLFFIAQRFGVSISGIKSASGLAGDEIYPGQHLVIPDKAGSGARYTVVGGDTVFLISQRFGVSMDSIRKANNLWKDMLYPGQVLNIPVSSDKAKIVSRGASRSDLNLLTRVVFAEARGEPYEGQVAVAAVVLNRVKNPDFPNSISGVIYEPGAFTCVDDGQINLTPDETASKAAQDAVNGWDPTNGALFYWNPATAQSKWVWSRTITYRVGNHVFAK